MVPKSILLSVGTPLCPYGIAYCRAYGLSNCWLFEASLCCPMVGQRIPITNSSISRYCPGTNLPGLVNKRVCNLEFEFERLEKGAKQ